MSWGVSIGIIGIIVAFLLIPIDIMVTRKVKRRWASIFESTKTEWAALHEKCMLQTKRKECPAVITVCNDNLTISPVIGAIMEIPIKNSYIMSEGGFLVTERAKWATQERVKTGQEKSLLLFKTAYINVWVIGCFEK